MKHKLLAKALVLITLDKSVVIIPTYNEIANIEKMLETLNRLHPDLNVLIIDDGSPDGTANIVKDFQKKKQNLFILERNGKHSNSRRSAKLA
jgi:dolichol-phosphate mannosyltransferase